MTDFMPTHLKVQQNEQFPMKVYMTQEEIKNGPFIIFLKIKSIL